MTGALLLLLWSAGCATTGFVLGAILASRKLLMEAKKMRTPARKRRR